MKPKVALYLAGSIKKGHENPRESFWTEEDLHCLKENLLDFDVVFLNPAFRSDDLSDQRSVFGRDMLQVYCSHFVFVDARDRRGLGVGAEMMWAKMNKIPVLSWSPQESHYRKEKTTLLGVEVLDFIHPFVEALSDQIVETLEEGALWIRQVMQQSQNIKGVEYIHSCMEYYQEKQLHRDIPMKEFLMQGDILFKKEHMQPKYSEAESSK